MSNIDKQAQKELYAKVEQQAHSLRGSPREYQALTGLCPVNVIEMHAQKIQALLDELEAKDNQLSVQRDYYEGVIADGSKRISELEAREVKLPDIKNYLSDVTEPTLDRALRLTAKGVRSGDIAAIRAAGIRIKGED